MKRSIVWFREDLRLSDNEAISDAIKMADETLFVYVFDTRTFLGKTQKFGFPKTGKYRAKFILESIIDLKNNLKKLGADLIVKVGITEDILYDLVIETSSSWVYCNRERTTEEEKVQDNLEKKLWTVGRELRYSRGKMLYHTQDLPFPVQYTPDTFTQFRKEVERIVKIRKPIPTIDKINPISIKIDYGTVPTLEELGHQEFESDERAVLPFKGGESAAKERLNYYFQNKLLPKTYKETRNQLIGGDYSTKFSVWLAHGCISPKTIYAELLEFEQKNGSNESTYWIFFELLWRDFFRLQGKKHGKKIFLINGPLGEANEKWKNDTKLFSHWANAQTGNPFIDANMLELKNTGFMSNRGRQNVASYLVKDLNINWQMGAEYFESMLIDYDPCSNWGNWNYVAGVGCDPRENRYFNILKQSKMYDGNGEYIKYWLPQFVNLPKELIHQPDQITASEQEKYNFYIGKTYPKALISSKKWL